MDGMQWMASAMHAARSQLETATHNLSNVSSDGFRRFASDVRMSERGLVASERHTFEQGAIRHTGRDLDLAIVGKGSFHVGDTHTRSGGFVRDRDGFVVDDRGRRLYGEHGPLRIPPNATVANDGSVVVNGETIDRIPLPSGTTIQSGARESSNVDAVSESLAILTAQRAFETAEKTLAAIDETRQKAANELGRLK